MPFAESQKLAAACGPNKKGSAIAGTALEMIDPVDRDLASPQGRFILSSCFASQSEDQDYGEGPKTLWAYSLVTAK